MVKIKVCCGTSCYIMGASELIDSSFKDDSRVDIEGSTCMGLCKSGTKRPPYVTINNIVYSQVTLSEFQDLIQESIDALQ